MTPLLSYADVARIIGCSRAQVSDLALAAEYAAEIKTGARQVEDVPPRLKRHLNKAFPAVIKIGQRIKRIDPADFERYLKRSKVL